MSLRSQVETGGPRSPAAATPAPANPAALKRPRSPPSWRAAASRDLSPAPALPSHLTPRRVSRPRSCRVHRPGHRSWALRPVWTRSAWWGVTRPSGSPGTDGRSQGCSWSVRKIRVCLLTSRWRRRRGPVQGCPTLRPRHRPLGVADRSRVRSTRCPSHESKRNFKRDGGGTWLRRASRSAAGPSGGTFSGGPAAPRLARP